MLKFFYSTATCSTVSHIALEEAALPFTGVEVSWKRKLNVEELEKASPLGAVPALLVDGKLITQNAAILEYIADSKPSGLLAKAGSLERAETMGWVSLATADLQKAFAPILGAHRMNLDDKAKAEIRSHAIKNIEKYLTHIDSSLAGKEYIMGKDFTVADAALFTFIGWTKWIELKTAPYANITSYMKRVYNRPAVKKVLTSEGLLDYLQD